MRGFHLLNVRGQRWMVDTPSAVSSRSEQGRGVCESEGSKSGPPNGQWNQAVHLQPRDSLTRYHGTHHSHSSGAISQHCPPCLCLGYPSAQDPVPSSGTNASPPVVSLITGCSLPVFLDSKGDLSASQTWKVEGISYLKVLLCLSPSVFFLRPLY